MLNVTVNSHAYSKNESIPEADDDLLDELEYYESDDYVDIDEVVGNSRRTSKVGIVDEEDALDGLLKQYGF